MVLFDTELRSTSQFESTTLTIPDAPAFPYSLDKTNGRQTSAQQEITCTHDLRATAVYPEAAPERTLAPLCTKQHSRTLPTIPPHPYHACGGNSYIDPIIQRTQYHNIYPTTPTQPSRPYTAWERDKAHTSWPTRSAGCCSGGEKFRCWTGQACVCSKLLKYCCRIIVCYRQGFVGDRVSTWAARGLDHGVGSLARLQARQRLLQRRRLLLPLSLARELFRFPFGARRTRQMVHATSRVACENVQKLYQQSGIAAVDLRSTRARRARPLVCIIAMPALMAVVMTSSA